LSISPTLYEQPFRQFPFAKRHLKTVSGEKLSKTLFNEKVARKMLMNLAPGKPVFSVWNKNFGMTRI